MKIPSIGTLGLIDKAIIANVKLKGRGYLGMSQLGHECERKVWYDYTSPQPVLDARINRIFQMGHMLEEYAVKLLRDSGITVFNEDENGKQFGVVLEGGKIAGHVDGVLLGLPESSKPHLWEFKTMKNTQYNQLLKKGVKEFSDTYYGQIQMYMGELKLNDCLFMAMNKDNCEMYCERVKYDKFLHTSLRNRAVDIVNSTDEPDRAYKKSTFYKCNMCSYKETCWRD